MSVSDLDRIVDEYLDQLDVALVELSPARRHRLLAELAEHVEQARTELPEQTEVALRSLLDRVGQPEDIAAAALAEAGDRPTPPPVVPTDSPRSRRHPRSLVGGLVVLAVVLAVGIVLAVTLVAGPTAPRTKRPNVTTTAQVRAGPVTIPNLTGESGTQALTALRSLGLACKATVVSSPSGAGVVVSQSPPAGSVAERGRIPPVDATDRP